MTPLTRRITEILEAQQVEEVRIGDPDFPRDQVTETRILGIATTAEKIVEAVGGGWNEAIEAAVLIVNEAREEGETELRSIRARIAYLRRPDTAPARERPSLERIAQAIDPIAMNNRSKAEPWKLRRAVAMERAADVLMLLEGK